MSINAGTKLSGLLLVNVAGGVLALSFLLRSPSMDRNIALAGYSLARLGLITVTFLIWAGCLAWLARARHRPATVGDIIPWLGTRPGLIDILLRASIVLTLTYLGLLLAALTGNWEKLGPIGTLLERGAPLFIWLASIQLEIFFLVASEFKQALSGWEWTERLSFVATAGAVVFIVLDTLLRTGGELSRYAYLLRPQVASGFVWAVGIFTVLALLLNGRGAQPGLLLRCAAVFISVWLLYHLTAVAVKGFYQSGSQAFFPDLAAAFLQGKTYLDNPSQTIDLVNFGGHWYMPYPPLVALLMLPEVALFGPANLNTVDFCITFASLNVALVFAILEQLRARGWTPGGSRATLWLVVMFTVGTVHWYLSAWGEAWPLNQLTALTCVALAVLLVLAEAPAALAGLSLGLAMMARPHVVLAWPLLLGIFLEIRRRQGDPIRAMDVMRWTLLSGIPIVLIVAGLSGYNFVRFGSPFDFGYAASNIGLFKQDIGTYGQFNLYYIPRNFQVAILGLPAWNAACGFFAPSVFGFSIFLATPALVFLYRAFQKTPWVLGAWASAALIFMLLFSHYSPGASQFGYRFLMDLIVPLIMLMALAVRHGKPRLPMKLLILAGVLVNYWGLWWFFRHWCR